MTTVSVSMRSAQSILRPPEEIQSPSTGVVAGAEPRPTWMKAIHDRTAETASRPVVTISD